jgi:hypothetical protein
MFQSFHKFIHSRHWIVQTSYSVQSKHWLESRVTTREKILVKPTCDRNTIFPNLKNHNDVCTSNDILSKPGLMNAL